MRDRFYLTTTLPYVNAPPHIGFALELVQADILARYHKLLGHEVFFNTGTDEHGLKIYRAAGKESKDPQKYVDEYAAKFDRLTKALNLTDHNFIRTTDPHHISAAQEFWRRCEKNDDIEQKLYQIKYCVECELEKSESELDHGRCIIHPHAEIEIIEEENYFFKFKNYEKKLLKLYEDRPDFVVPKSRFNEIKKFVESGLEDFSISRLKEKMPWGVPVPGDDEHVMYVWFDALINYISAIGWPDKMDEFEKWWPVTQLAGKDQVRQQAAMWQAMLMSAGIEPSKQIVIHGFITSGGQKMSKSLGNVIDPFEMVEKYGTDAVRYYLTHHINSFEDSDFTEGKLREVYKANLAEGGLGNTVRRVMTMAEKDLDRPVNVDALEKGKIEEWRESEKQDYRGRDSIYQRQLDKFGKHLNKFEFHQAADVVWDLIKGLDSDISNFKPFKTKLRDLRQKEIERLVKHLWQVTFYLEPLLPDTTKKIQGSIKQNKDPQPLFPSLQ